MDLESEDHSEGRYLTAQVCLSGHLVNDQYESAQERNRKFCERCGEPTLIECGNCGARLLGYYLSHRGHGSHGLGTPPAFCYSCGFPHVWTAASIQSARDLAAELEDLRPEDRELFNRSIEDLVRDTPRTNLAAARVKKMLSKAGPAAKAIWDTLRPVLTQAAAQQLGL